MEDELFYMMKARILDIRLILNVMKKSSPDCSPVFKSFFDSVSTLSVYLLQCENALNNAHDLEVVRPF